MVLIVGVLCKRMVARMQTHLTKLKQHTAIYHMLDKALDGFWEY